jgi:hypothetical protein
MFSKTYSPSKHATTKFDEKEYKFLKKKKVWVKLEKLDSIEEIQLKKHFTESRKGVHEFDPYEFIKNNDQVDILNPDPIIKGNNGPYDNKLNSSLLGAKPYKTSNSKENKLKLTLNSRNSQPRSLARRF